ncbi:MAG: hypothetical protein ABIP39_14500 [Polyangiaceae bacterium]
MTRRVFVFAAACALLVSCATDKKEARALSTAIERFRLASDAEKGAAATQIAAVECTDAAVCEAKQACVAASDATAKGLALKAEVERLLADVQAKRLAPDDPSAKALPDKLDDADRLLKAGHRDMKACDEKVMALKLKYGV